MAGETIAGFGPRLKEVRVSMGLRQADIAEPLGVARFAVSNWECGDTCPTLATFRSLCENLGVSADYLLDLAPTDITPEEYALIKRVRKLGPVRVQMLSNIVDHLNELRPATPADLSGS